MLEMGDVLRTWALPRLPEPDVEIICDSLADHRLAYLDYEGPISGQRGSVRRHDRGTYEIVRRSNSLLEVELTGEKIIGRAKLRRISNEPGRWQFSFTCG